MQVNHLNHANRVNQVNPFLFIHNHRNLLKVPPCKNHLCCRIAPGSCFAKGGVRDLTWLGGDAFQAMEALAGLPAPSDPSVSKGRSFLQW